MQSVLLNSGITSSLKRKIRQMFLSALYGLSGQVSSMLFSVVTIWFFSAEFWGEYSRLMITVNLFLILCSWGSKQYLTTRSNQQFYGHFSLNLASRVPLLVVSVVAIFFIPGPQYAYVCFLLINRFFCQSFEAVVVKDRKFVSVLGLELFLLVLFVACSALYKSWAIPVVDGFLLLLMCLELARTVFYAARFRQVMMPVKMREVWLDELKAGLPFFANAVIGFFTSRLDYFLSSLYLGVKELALYQIMFNFVFLLQGVANFIFYTYVFQFFRLSPDRRRKFIRFYFLIGLLISIVFFGCIRQVLGLYQMRVDRPTAAMLAAFVVLGFLQQPFIYGIYQMGRTRLVSIISLVSIGVLLGTIFLFSLNGHSLGIYQFILSALIGQFSRSILFIVVGWNFLRQA